MLNYITELKDDEQRRIIVPRDVWNFLKLKKGDFIKVTIEKATKQKDTGQSPTG